MENAFQVSSLVVITGAARGIGQATAVAIAKQIQKSKQSQASRLVLLDILDLSATREQIQTASDVPVSLVSCDLSETDRFDELTNRVLQDVNPKAFQQAFLINNAATLLYKLPWEFDPVEIEKYLRLNVASMVALSAWFVRTFKSPDCQVLLVNLTSASTRRPVRATVAYSMSNTAREVFIRDMVNDDSSVCGFSFGPGIVDTEMTRTSILSGNEKDPDLIKRMDKLRAQGVITTPAHVADKMVTAIVEKRYQNGGRVDAAEI